MKSSVNISIAATLVVLSTVFALSSAGMEWKCKGHAAKFSDELLKVMSECHGEVQEEKEDRVEKFYDAKICLYKKTGTMKEGKLDMAKLKETMTHMFEGTNVGAELADVVQAQCGSKADVNFDTDPKGGKEFVKCMMHHVFQECHKTH